MLKISTHSDKNEFFKPRAVNVALLCKAKVTLIVFSGGQAREKL